MPPQNQAIIEIVFFEADDRLNWSGLTGADNDRFKQGASVAPGTHDHQRPAAETNRSSLFTSMEQRSR